MPLKESYVIWNNKGGVGKTTLTFHIATEYAKQHQTENGATVNVLVIDLCPQANASMALLSSPEVYGSAHLSTLYRNGKTISHYLKKSTQRGPTIKVNEFITRVSEYNRQVPANLFLLCGDMKLELVGRHLEHSRRGYDAPDDSPWLNNTCSVRSFIEGSKDLVDGVSESDEEWVVFIDTNPAFSVYTEIALAAARKLIIPINSDDFSVEAVRAMLDLVYGIHPQQGQEKQDQYFEAYRNYMFSSKAESYNLRLPQIHLLVNNRVTVYHTRAATAFSAMGEENFKVLYEAYTQHQAEKQCFSPPKGKIDDEKAFKEHYSVDLRDFHSIAIVSLHTGCPLSCLGGIQGKAKISEKVMVHIDKNLLSAYTATLEKLVQKL
ncbi:unnamed protein product [Pocillopora meandrina]|uniref:AAA domain-containing protein n=1 Tax=Pocillopora meandrina TaxID=46732 RepID=A0AAU9XRV2_9CNID|nr:unnamed protein product [Pocillopora meandrina]